MGEQLCTKSLTLSKEAQYSHHQLVNAIKKAGEGTNRILIILINPSFLNLIVYNCHHLSHPSVSIANLQYFVSYKRISSCVLLSF